MEDSQFDKYEGFDDGAGRRRRRLKDLVTYIMDHPGTTMQELIGHMIVMHGLDSRTVEKYVGEMVRYDFIRGEQRRLKPGDGSSSGVDIGLGYYPNGRAHEWLRK